MNEESIPKDLTDALAASPQALAAWTGLTAISRRDFTSWIETAKLEETRRRRIERACENLVKGKRRPCCYSVVPMDLYKVLGTSPEAKAEWSKLTSDQKRDFADWLEDSEDREARRARVKEICALVASGATKPA